MVLIAACLTFPVASWAAEGDLDPSFGNGGRVVTTVGTNPRQKGMAIDPQGRILVVGAVNVTPSDGNMVVARYLPDGTLDPSFNGFGVKTYDFPAANDSDEADAVAVDPQGRILVFGSTPGAGGTDFALIRLSSDGTRDASFGPAGSNGFVTKDFAGGIEFPAAVAVDAQGRIVVAGSAEVGGDKDFAILRYDANGLLDNTFSGDGRQTVDFTPFANDDDFALDMAIDAQGRIVLAGRTQQPTFRDFALARLTTDGSRDPTFGPNTDPNTRGEVTTPIGTSDDGANALTIDPQGRILAAGSAIIGPSNQFAVARYNTDGSLDSSFSGDGKQTTSINSEGDGDSAHYVGVDSHGRIVLAGQPGVPGGTDGYALTRYEPNGELDPTFGTGGKVTLANGLVRSAAMDAQDRIVVGGLFTPVGGPNSQFGLARFIGDAVAPTVSIGAGPADGAVINDPTPSFEFSASEPDAALACGFDGASASCASPFAPAPLGDGQHTFAVTATDRAGNTSSPATRTFTVDTQAPGIDISGKKKVKTHKKKAKAKLEIRTSEPADLTCAVDAKAATPCGGDYRTPKLKKGRHEVTVTATDEAGNSSSADKRIKVVRKR